MMKLVESSSGLGELTRQGSLLRQVRYKVRRYHGFTEGSEMPIPGLFRIEGTLDFDREKDPSDWINIPLVLRLDDGRALGIVLADDAGRILSEGHGPLKCMCC